MESQNRLVRKYVKCSRCKLFDDILINPLKTDFYCNRCHLPLKEISEQEYKEKKQKLKELMKKRNENNYRQNNNPNRINIHIPPSTQNNQRGNNRGQNRNENEENRGRGNSSLHYSTLNMNNMDDNREEERNINNNRDNNRRNNRNNNNININIQQNNNNVNNNQHQGARIHIIINGNRHGGNDNQNNRRRREHSSERNNTHSNNVMHQVIGNMLNPFSHMSNQIIMNNSRHRNPFRIVVQRQNVSHDIFDPFFSNFGSVFGGAFQDNFSSNFRSNFRGNFVNEILRVIQQNAAENRRRAHPPTSKENLNKLKQFSMNEKYCKKEKDNIEMPNCSICLEEIAMGAQTILLPCGHMFHSNCILTWLKKNNTCPLCRFEIK